MELNANIGKIVNLETILIVIVKCVRNLKMKHIIYCSCGKLLVKCKTASKAIEDLIQIRIKEYNKGKNE